jgi:hypothetical protein
MAFDLPRDCLIFDRAAKVVPTEDGGSRVLVYNEIHDEGGFFPNEQDPQVTNRS